MEGGGPNRNHLDKDDKVLVIKPDRMGLTSETGISMGLSNISPEVTLCPQDGQTALHQAASAGHGDTVAALILGGCDVSLQDFVSPPRLNLS